MHLFASASAAVVVAAAAAASVAAAAAVAALEDDDDDDAAVKHRQSLRCGGKFSVANTCRPDRKLIQRVRSAPTTHRIQHMRPCTRLSRTEMESRGRRV